MTSAALDRLLAVLVVALAATGLISLRMGAPSDGWVFFLHGLLGGSLALVASWKVGRSLPRAVRAGRWRRVALGLLVSAGTAAALVGGFAWVASGRVLSIGAWTVLTIHAWIGLALVPLVVVHLLPRRWRLLVPGRRPAARPGPQIRGRDGLSRRRILVGGLLGGASVALFGASQVADRLAGGVRRFTGSRWLPPGVPPPTTFFGEAGPHIDPAAWRLRVHGNVARPLSLSLAEMQELGALDRTVVLDCTSGWAMAAEWRGVPLRAVLGAAHAISEAAPVVVRSATGWATALSPTDVDRTLLATAVAGGPLPAANGAPVRLVVPDRRGLDWVKWVTEIEVV